MHDGQQAGLLSERGRDCMHLIVSFTWRPRVIALSTPLSIKEAHLQALDELLNGRQQAGLLGERTIDCKLGLRPYTLDLQPHLMT